MDLDQLFYIDGMTIELIDRGLAEADDDGNVVAGSGLGNSEPRTGYIFRDLSGRVNGTDFTLDEGGNGYLDGFALWGYPDHFGRSGRSSMVVSIDGTVYGKVIEVVAGDADWDAEKYPDISADEWLPLSE